MSVRHLPQHVPEVLELSLLGANPRRGHSLAYAHPLLKIPLFEASNILLRKPQGVQTKSTDAPDSGFGLEGMVLLDPVPVVGDARGGRSVSGSRSFIQDVVRVAGVAGVGVDVGCSLIGCGSSQSVLGLLTGSRILGWGGFKDVGNRQFASRRGGIIAAACGIIIPRHGGVRVLRSWVRVGLAHFVRWK